MSRLLSGRMLALCITLWSGVAMGRLAYGQEVAVSLSDTKPAPKSSLKKLDDGMVFRLLLGKHGDGIRRTAANGSWKPQEQTLPTEDSESTMGPELVRANFDTPADVSSDERQGNTDENATPKIPAEVLPLNSQQKIFDSLWGANDSKESQNRFDTLRSEGRIRLGGAVRLATDESYPERAMAGGVYTWAAPDFYHHPLYFEQVNLERYGQGPHHAIQPIYSAAHFFATVTKLPYHLVTSPPCERVYTLGHHRPGNCAPYQWHRTRFSWKGAVVQGLTSAGTAVIVP
jgi:hypothetical protein